MAYHPDNLPPPPGFDDLAPARRGKPPVVPIVAGVVALLLVAGGVVFVLKKKKAADGAETPAPPVASSGDSGTAIVGAPVPSQAPDYGSAEAGFPGLPGRFYDLVKSPEGRKTGLPVSPAAAETFVREFLKGEMTESVMNARFFSEPAVLRSARFVFGTTKTEAVQTFFGETNLKAHAPLWAVVYRGRVKAPFTGEFRFVGYGSDRLAVRFGGNPAFEAWHARLKPVTQPEPEEAYWFGKPNKERTYTGDPVRAGAWLAVEKGKIYDIEIVCVHAQAYSYAKFYLMYERRGEAHPADADGYRTYPRFRVADDPVVPPEPTQPLDPKKAAVEESQFIPATLAGDVFPVVP